MVVVTGTNSCETVAVFLLFSCSALPLPVSSGCCVCCCCDGKEDGLEILAPTVMEELALLVLLPARMGFPEGRMGFPMPMGFPRVSLRFRCEERRRDVDCVVGLEVGLDVLKLEVDVSFVLDALVVEGLVLSLV